jgi:hypothetical protein
MSKGPGRVERAIEDVFTARPDATFTVDELAAYVFHGVNYVEKKHRVSVIRAADKVAQRLNWMGRRAERRGGQVVYSNLLNARSYRLGMLRRDFVHNDRSLLELEALLDKERENLRPGGVWQLHVEINRAEIEGDAEASAELRVKLTRMVHEKCASAQ